MKDHSYTFFEYANEIKRAFNIPVGNEFKKIKEMIPMMTTGTFIHLDNLLSKNPNWFDQALIELNTNLIETSKEFREMVIELKTEFFSLKESQKIIDSNYTNIFTVVSLTLPHVSTTTISQFLKSKGYSDIDLSQPGEMRVLIQGNNLGEDGVNLDYIADRCIEELR